MKYVEKNARGGFDLTGYQDYLDREAGQLAKLVKGENLLAIDRFDLSGPGSFHDARFESISIGRRRAATEGGLPRAALRLRGPYFDRYFSLTYNDVSTLRLTMPAPEADLLIHELRIEAGRLVHELHFDGNDEIFVCCRDVRFVEDLAAEERGSG